MAYTYGLIVFISNGGEYIEIAFRPFGMCLFQPSTFLLGGYIITITAIPRKKELMLQ